MALHSRFVLRSLLNALLRPPLLVFLANYFHIVPLPESRLLQVLLYVASVPLQEAVRSAVSSHRKRAERIRLGAQPVPKVKGKKLGNWDILQELIQSEKEEYPGDLFRRWAREYGPTFDMNILFSSQIVTIDPENVKYVLSSAFMSFEKSEKFHDMFEAFWGDGIFTTDGVQWKHHRTVARPFFERDRLSDLETFERHLQRLLEILEGHARTGEPLDLQDLYSRYTLDTATEFLMGSSTDSLESVLDNTSNPQQEAFLKAFNELTALGALRVRIGSNWPLFELFGDPSKGPTRVIDSFVNPLVDLAIRSYDPQADVKDRTFLDHLLQSSKDLKEVRDELLNILFAARDTMTSLFTWITYIFATHPQILERARNEVLAIVPETRAPSMADLRQMRYLEAVITETLRVFAPVPYNIRRSRITTALPSPRTGHPLYVPMGSSITYAPILIQRDPDLWGPDAAEFKPERWLDNRQPASHANAFMAFNLGPRTCLGQQQARLHARYVFARLLQRVDGFDLAPECQPHGTLPRTASWLAKEGADGRHGKERIWPAATITLHAKGGLWARTRWKV